MFKVKNKDTKKTLLYTLKTSENQRFSDVFRGYNDDVMVLLFLTLKKFRSYFYNDY